MKRVTIEEGRWVGYSIVRILSLLNYSYYVKGLSLVGDRTYDELCDLVGFKTIGSDKEDDYENSVKIMYKEIMRRRKK